MYEASISISPSDVAALLQPPSPSPSLRLFVVIVVVRSGAGDALKDTGPHVPEDLAGLAEAEHGEEDHSCQQTGCHAGFG